MCVCVYCLFVCLVCALAHPLEGAVFFSLFAAAQRVSAEGWCAVEEADRGEKIVDPIKK